MLPWGAPDLTSLLDNRSDQSLFYDNNLWNSPFCRGSKFILVQLRNYTASSADITHPDFTEQTRVPWIEIWITPESQRQHFAKIAEKWNHSRMHINRSHTLQTEKTGYPIGDVTAVTAWRYFYLTPTDDLGLHTAVYVHCAKISQSSRTSIEFT